MTNRSETIGKLAEALAKAQKNIKAAIKGAQNPFFKSSYADLPAIVAACREQLASNGIAVIQSTGFDVDGVFLQTMLVHSSGEWVSGTYPIRPVKPDPQSMGSAVTYARRYCLAAMVGVVAEDEDDDGAAASGTVRAVSRDDKGEALKKARAWAEDAMRFIKSTDAEGLKKWEGKNADTLVKLAGIDPDTHAQLVAAIQDVQ